LWCQAPDHETLRVPWRSSQPGRFETQKTCTIGRPHTCCVSTQNVSLHVCPWHARYVLLRAWRGACARNSCHRPPRCEKNACLTLALRPPPVADLTDCEHLPTQRLSLDPSEY
jgi:hypothetical protein